MGGPHGYFTSITASCPFFKIYFQAVVQQVLKRIEDVQKMCEKRKESLCSLGSKPLRSRPVQHVLPEPMPPQASTGYNGLDQTDLDPEVRKKGLLENNKRSPLSLEKSARVSVFLPKNIFVSLSLIWWTH